VIVDGKKYTPASDSSGGRGMTAEAPGGEQ